MIAQARTCWIMALADSSPRAGWEWLFAEFFLVWEHLAEQFVEARDKLVAMQKAFKDGEDYDHKLAKKCRNEMCQAVWHIVLPPSCMGTKQMGLHHKLTLLLHMTRLNCPNWRTVKVLFASILQFLTDFGTESKIATVPPVDANKVFKHWNELAAISDNETENCGNLEIATVDDGILELHNSIATPGLEHMLHNVEQQALPKCKHFKDWYAGAKQLSRLLG